MLDDDRIRESVPLEEEQMEWGTDVSLLLPFLAEEVIAGRAFFITGAGICVGTSIEQQLGQGLPLGQQLARELSIVRHVPQDRVDADDLSTVAAWVQNTYGRAVLLEFLKQRLSVAGQQPLLAHRRLAVLPVRLIATTNYDDLHEKAFEERGISTISLVGQDEIPLVSDVGERRAVILKLHGDLRSMRGIVITSDNFVTFFDQSPQLVVALQHYLSTRTAIFVGHSLRDHNVQRLIQEVWQAFPRTVRRAFAIQWQVGPQDVASWDDLGVTLIEEDVTQFLGRLALEVNRLDRHRSVTMAERSAASRRGVLRASVDEQDPVLLDMLIQSQLAAGSVTMAADTLIRRAHDLAAANQMRRAAELYLRAAEMMHDRQVPHRAANHYRQALDLLHGTLPEDAEKEQWNLLRLRAHLGAAQILLDELNAEAERHLGSALEIARALRVANNQEACMLELDARIEMARCYSIANRVDQAITDLKTLTADPVWPENAKGQVWLELAIIHEQRAEWDEVDTVLDHARLSDQSQADPSFLLLVEKHQAMSYALRGDWDAAVHAYETCQKLLSLLPPTEAGREAVDIHRNSSVVRSSIAQMAGLEDQQRALDTRVDTEAWMDTADLHEHYGLQYRDRGELSMALREYHQAEVRHQRAANLVRLLRLKTRLGQLYSASKQAKYVLPALRQFMEAGDEKGVQKACEPILTIQDRADAQMVFGFLLSPSKSAFERVGRLAALGYLADIAPPEHISQIITLLLDVTSLPINHEENVRTKRAAVETLAKYAAQLDQEQALGVLVRMLDEAERQQPWPIRSAAVNVMKHIVRYNSLPPAQSEEAARRLRRVAEGGEGMIDEEARQALILIAERFGEGKARKEALAYLRCVPGHWSAAMQVALKGEVDHHQVIDATQGAIQGLRSVVTVTEGQTRIAWGITTPQWLIPLRDRIPTSLLDDVINALLGITSHSDVMIADRCVAARALQPFANLVLDKAAEKVTSSMIQLVRDPSLFEGVLSDVTRQGMDPLASFRVQAGEPADLQATAIVVLGDYLARVQGETHEQALYLIMQSLRDPNAKMRGAGARTLFQVASHLPKRLLRDAYLLLFALTNDADGNVRAWSTYSLGKMAELVDPDEQKEIIVRLTHLSTDTEQQVRLATAQIVGELFTVIDWDEAVDLVSQILETLRQDVSSSVRRAAAVNAQTS